MEKVLQVAVAEWRCMEQVRAQLEADGRGEAAATMLHGLAAMLYEAQEYNEALVWAKEALKLREAQQKGKRTGMAVAEHLVQVAECMSKAGSGREDRSSTMFCIGWANINRKYF